MSTSIIAKILKSAGLAALGLSFAVASANAQPPIFCALKSDLMGCPGAGATTTLPASSAANTAADILNRNAAAQRALEQGFDRMREIIHNRQAADNRSYASTPSSPTYGRNNGDGFGTDHSPYAYVPQSASDSADCWAQRSTYHYGNPGSVSGCTSALDSSSTYRPGSLPGYVPYSAPETVIDGSDIPCSISFPPDPLNPFDGVPCDNQIQPTIDFPASAPRFVAPHPTDATGVITDRNLNIFDVVTDRINEIERRQRSGTR